MLQLIEAFAARKTGPAIALRQPLLMTGFREHL